LVESVTDVLSAVGGEGDTGHLVLMVSSIEGLLARSDIEDGNVTFYVTNSNILSIWTASHGKSGMSVTCLDWLDICHKLEVK
jgi:hypothetical protein